MRRFLIPLLFCSVVFAQDTTKFVALSLPPYATLDTASFTGVYETADGGMFASADGATYESIAGPTEVVVLQNVASPMTSNSTYYNSLYLGSVTTNTVSPFRVAFRKLPTSATTLVSAKRFAFGIDTVSTDLSAIGYISGRNVTLLNYRTGTGDITGVGLFRIQIVAKASDNSVQDEANVIVRVVY